MACSTAKVFAHFNSCKGCQRPVPIPKYRASLRLPILGPLHTFLWTFLVHCLRAPFANTISSWLSSISPPGRLTAPLQLKPPKSSSSSSKKKKFALLDGRGEEFSCKDRLKRNARLGGVYPQQPVRLSAS